MHMPPLQQRLPTATGEETGDSFFTRLMSLGSRFARWSSGERRTGNMAKPQISGAPRPINTLSSTNGAPARTTTGISPPFRSTTTPGPSPAKRQRLDDPSTSFSHSQATFAPAEPSKPRGQSIASVSVAESQRSLASTTSPSQHGFRSVDRETKRKRPRRSRGSPRLPAHEELIETSGSKPSPVLGHSGNLSDDEVNLISPLAKSAGLPRPKRKRVEILEIADRFQANAPLVRLEAQRKFGDAIDEAEKRVRRGVSDMSPDELAPSKEEIAASRPPKRPRNVPSSLSRRGDIQQTTFKGGNPTTRVTTTTSTELDRVVVQLQKAQLVIGTGLRIMRGTSGQCQYQSSYKGDPDPCFLSVREIGHTLFPVDQSNELLKDYTYLTLDIKRVQSILCADSDETCWIAVVKYSNVDLNNSAGAQLMLEFASAQELNKFFQWVEIYREGRLPVKKCSRDKLEADFTEATRRAISHSVITDASVADDIRVIQHNHENRAYGTQIVRQSAPGYRAGPKRKDAMTISPAEPNGSGIALSQLWDGQPTSVRRLPRTTRQMLAPLESPEPEPEGWTSLNAGWEKRWRNSLVYPGSGKNRATVDKDDIQRLDEGQFLNDNIIIFYFRYLQKNLEDSNKDLAKRIYFQNTFFYDKLKPTKAGQGINYDSVKTWTSKVDLFSKDYIIVPINEYTHWYVAIICNAPRLLPALDAHDQAEGTKCGVDVLPHDPKTTQEASEAFSQKEHPTVYTKSEVVQPVPEDVVVENLRRMSIDSCDRPSNEAQQTTGNNVGEEVNSISTKSVDGVYVIKDSDEPETVVGDVATAANPQTRKKTVKRLSVGPRKLDPNQPRIITLDSLGAPHSPTCTYLKQYLVAELKDKRRIEITPPGAMGTTAKGIPEQTNHCDCGLFLLGYIQQFLLDPDNFVKSLLQRDGEIPWDLDPSKLRKNIRDLIFSLQAEQQKTEDLVRERKQQAKMNRQQSRGQETSDHTAAPAMTTCAPSKIQPAAQDCHSDKASESKRSPFQVNGQPPSPRGSTVTTVKVMRHEHLQTYGKNTEHTGPEVRPSPDNIVSDTSVNTRQEEIGTPSDAQEAHTTPKADLHMVASLRKPEPRSDYKTHYVHDKGLVSPARNEAAECRPLSPETETSMEIERGFLGPLASETESSKSSRGATPRDPYVVDDSDNNQQGRVQYSPQRYKESQTGHESIMPKSSVHINNQSPEHDGNINNHKRTGPKSPYFANRQDGERMTAAKLRQSSLNGVIDLSDD
ncbi:hypothetical protein F5Y14DRAFT_374457 [Nemania sp. NC0429]|nr:hypothetical protein F5Y14DRAFT_374457 [Nemania sp. NC0429]